MPGYILMKRLVQNLVAGAGAGASFFPPAASVRRVCILAYHRVAPIPFVDGSHDAWNVPPAVFARQAAFLAEFAHVIRLSELPAFLEQPPSTVKPVVAITFDDGYANNLIYAYPWLERYGLPATFSVVTNCVDTPGPMPFDRWGRVNVSRAHASLWRPLSWDELDTAVASGLISVGGHSHTHPDPHAPGHPSYAEEVGRCREALVSHYGPGVIAYTYPYGSSRLGFVTSDHVTAVRQAGFSLGLTTDLGLAEGLHDRLRLPRVEVLACDSPRVLRGKICGALAPYALTASLRRSARTH